MIHFIFTLWIICASKSGYIQISVFKIVMVTEIKIAVLGNIDLQTPVLGGDNTIMLHIGQQQAVKGNVTTAVFTLYSTQAAFNAQHCRELCVKWRHLGPDCNTGM